MVLTEFQNSDVSEDRSLSKAARQRINTIRSSTSEGKQVLVQTFKCHLMVA